jgi:hypothetical protein
VQDFLDSLNGANGRNGVSAYQEWLNVNIGGTLINEGKSYNQYLRELGQTSLFNFDFGAVKLYTVQDIWETDPETGEQTGASHKGYAPFKGQTNGGRTISTNGIIVGDDRVYGINFAEFLPNAVDLTVWTRYLAFSIEPDDDTGLFDSIEINAFKEEVLVSNFGNGEGITTDTGKWLKVLVPSFPVTGGGVEMVLEVTVYYNGGISVFYLVDNIGAGGGGWNGGSGGNPDPGDGGDDGKE